MRYLANGTLLLFFMLFLTACTGDAPKVTSFTSNPSTPVEAGTSVKLTAVYIGGTGSIDNGVGSISSGSSVEVTVDVTTTYTITIIDGAGDTATSSLTVEVGVAPEDVVAPTITSFTAAATTIAIGGSVDLSAVFENGTAVIDNGAGSSITSGGSVTVSPTTKTTYTLTVTNTADVAVTKTVTVDVVKLDALSVSTGALVQTFQSNSLSYDATVGFLGSDTKVQASSADTGTTIKVNGVDVDANNLSQSINLAEGFDALVSVTATRDAVTATYSLTIRRPTLTNFIEQVLRARDAEGGDYFGYEVSLSGDTLAVGAHRESTAGAFSGAVYVYTRSGTTWTEQAIIHASDAEAGDYFGISVSLSGDTLVVGAERESGGVSNPITYVGAVYIYTRSGTTWNEQPKIYPSDANSSFHFGHSVSLSGDTLAVGAYSKNTYAGAAYVFIRSGTTWSEQAIIHASNRGNYDYFGGKVSLSGDTLAIGAIGEGTDGANAGAAYVFIRSGTDWTEQAIIRASDAAAYDNFGVSISLSDDTLAVGAYGENFNRGAVYIYTRSGTTWTEQPIIRASDNASNNYFGASVSFSGVDNDTLAVGAWGKPGAYVYTRFGTKWSERKIIGSGAFRFGNSVSLSGDTLAVGAYGENTAGAYSGAVYIYK